MAWGLEARVPFLDKAFLEVSMNIDATEKMFSKGASQEVDEDGQPKMEKVRHYFYGMPTPKFTVFSTWNSVHPSQGL
jgi:hypothetical protein